MSGLYLSGYPLDEFEEKRKSVATCGIGQIDGLNEGDSIQGKVVIAGIITQSKVVYTKASQTRMAFLTLEDRTGKIEVIVFPKDFEKFHALIKEDYIVVIEGRVSKKSPGEPSKVVAETICDIQAYMLKNLMHPAELLKPDVPQKLHDKGIGMGYGCGRRQRTTKRLSVQRK